MTEKICLEDQTNYKNGYKLEYNQNEITDIKTL